MPAFKGFLVKLFRLQITCLVNIFEFQLIVILRTCIQIELHF